MKIRKRLAISNTVMFIVPIVLIVLIASVVLETFTEVYRSQLIGYQKEFFYNAEGFEKAIETMLTDMRVLVVNYLGIILLSAIVIIVLMNSFLASRITKGILVPLDLLRYGSNQIKEGNLDFRLGYKGKDEFEQVFSDFDEMRQRLKDSVELQLRYETDKRELVAGISHDLRTPLTVIKGYVEGLRDGVANTPEKQQNYLNMIYRKACDMDSLVDNLFLFSKMDTGHYPFDFQTVELRGYLSEFFAQARDEFSRKGLDISFYDHAEDDVFVKLDRREMGRVLANILGNIVKYKTGETGKVKAGLKRSGDGAVITIADNGPGVPQGELPKLFTRFYRGDPSRTNPQEGSGLGLAIAKHIVNSHEGSITARNHAGLEITIILPMKTREEYEADTDH
jgi:signal transduction histidine kinase